MAIAHCPGCGHDLAAAASSCPACGRSLNGVATPVPEGSEWLPSHGQPPSEKLSPEVMEWARQQFNEEEFIADLREIEQTGGLELQDFIRELVEEAAPRD
jgi:hypothetical protein